MNRNCYTGCFSGYSYVCVLQSPAGSSEKDNINFTIQQLANSIDEVWLCVLKLLSVPIYYIKCISYTQNNKQFLISYHLSPINFVLKNKAATVLSELYIKGEGCCVFYPYALVISIRNATVISKDNASAFAVLIVYPRASHE